MLSSLIQLQCQKGYICSQAESSSAWAIFEHEIKWKTKKKKLIFAEKSWCRSVFIKYCSPVIKPDIKVLLDIRLEMRQFGYGV